MVLASRGIRDTQRAIAAKARTTRKSGTSTKGLVAAVRSYGLTVKSRENMNIGDIKRALAKGSIVVVCYTEMQLNWGHYAIIIGFRGDSIRLIDPAERLGTIVDIDVKEFVRRWRDPLFTKSNRWAAFVS